MHLPENIAAVTQAPLVVETWDAIASLYERDDLPLLSTANLEIAGFLADAGALTAEALAVLVLDSHARASDRAPASVSATLRLFKEALPRGARTSDLQATMLMADTTAAMLHHATFLLRLRETRGHLCDKHGQPYDDDSLQIQFYMQAQAYIGVVSSLSSDSNIARFPQSFLHLCAREAGAHLDTVCKLSNQYISGVGHAAMDMTDTLSHFKARIEGYRSAYEAQQAREAAKVRHKNTVQSRMARDGTRYKL